MIGYGWYDETANRLFGGYRLKQGEKHVPQLKRDKSKLLGFTIVNSEYAGPGSQTLQSVKEGVQPAHDLRYDKIKSKEDERYADNKMLSKLKEGLSWKNPIESINQGIAWLGIKAKTVGEDLGIFKKNQFTTTGNYEKLSDEDKKIFDNKLSELEKQGFGDHISHINYRPIGYTSGCGSIHRNHEKLINCDICVNNLQNKIYKHLIR